MLRNLTLFLSLLFTTALTAQTYFWVGNSGNWSDLSHWATTSGGTEFHTALPGPENDVVFDANSFTAFGQSVTIDLEESFCRDFDASAVQFQPNISGLGFYDALYIHGDFSLSPEMSCGFRMIYLEGSGEVHIATGGVNLGGSSFLRCTGNADFHLDEVLSVANLYIHNGNFYTNGYDFTATARFQTYVSQPVGLYMSTSTVNANLWRVNSLDDCDFDQMTLHHGQVNNAFPTFDGGDQHYFHVTFYGEAEITGDNTFDLFEAMPGAVLEVEGGSTQEAIQFILQGSGDNYISILSDVSGLAANFVQSSGSVNGYYLNLKDNAASGGAEFVALASVDQGNVSGWSLEEIQPQDFYWVGGAGHWNDVSHWATASGGNLTHPFPPTAIDNVFFDLNSGEGEPFTVILPDASFNCNNLTVASAGSDLTLSQWTGGVLRIHGSLDLEAEANYGFSQIDMIGSGPFTINTHGSSLGNNASLFINTNGQVDLLSDISLRSMRPQAGVINFEGQSITCSFEFRIAPDFLGALNMSNAEINTRGYQFIGDGALLDVSGTQFNITGSFYGYGNSFDHVTFDGTSSNGALVRAFSGFTVENLTVLPGTELELEALYVYEVENLSMVGTADAPIVVRSNSEGSEASFSKASGVVDAYYLELTDNHAIGGAVFNAFNSVENGNVIGWNVEEEEEEEEEEETSVSDLIGEGEIKIYPNPASSVLTLEAKGVEELLLFDARGQVVLQERILGSRHLLSLPALASGLYHVVLMQGSTRVHSQSLMVR